ESFRGGERTASKEENHSPAESRSWIASSPTTTSVTETSPLEMAFYAKDTPLTASRYCWKSSLAPPAPAGHRNTSYRTARVRDTSAIEVSPSPGKNGLESPRGLRARDSCIERPPDSQTRVPRLSRRFGNHKRVDSPYPL